MGFNEIREQCACLWTTAEGKNIDWTVMSEKIYEAMVKDNAIFFKNDGKYFCCYSGEIYQIAKGNDQTSLFIYKITGLDETTKVHKRLGVNLYYQVMQKSILRENLSWIYSNKKERKIYLSNQKKIMHITKDSIVECDNGKDEIILMPSEKIQTFKYNPEITKDEFELALKECFTAENSCSPDIAKFIFMWAATFILIDFTKQRPILRFEGSPRHGKSRAMRLLSFIFYGNEEMKTSNTTEAAQYADSKSNPFCFIDQLEAKDFSSELLNFFLSASTGGQREKKDRLDDKKIVREKIKCLIASTGVEALGSELTELLSRSFYISFERDEGQRVSSENSVIAKIAQKRDILMSWVLKRTRAVLSFMENQKEYLDKFTAFYEDLAEYSKRCDEYLFMMHLVDSESGCIPYCVKLLEKNSKDQNCNSNPIVNCLDVFFKRAQKSGGDEYTIDKFMMPALGPDSDYIMGNAQEIHATFNLVKKWENVDYRYKNQRVLAQRLTASAEEMKLSGYEVKKRRESRGFVYIITKLNIPHYEEIQKIPE
jgi:hypothetical protein